MKTLFSKLTLPTSLLITFILSFICFIPRSAKAYDVDLAKRMHGRILLQVQDHGEAWYVRASDSQRYYMKDGTAAYEMMRFFSKGITDADLLKIPHVNNTTDMNKSTSVCASNPLANRMKGEILLQVQQHGEAWYVDPVKCRAIYMTNGPAAYEIMKYLGLGITNADLEKIQIGTIENITTLTTTPNTGDSKAEELVAEPEIIEISGNGKQISREFTLEQGLSIFKLSYKGNDESRKYFEVWLLDSKGNKINLLANATKEFDGSKAVRIDTEGEYLLEVSSNDEWKITIEQPRPQNIENTNNIFFGNEQEATPIFYLDEGYNFFNFTHYGDGYFGVWLLDKDGNNIELLVNGIDLTNFSKVVKIEHAGLYLFNVTSKKAGWSIEIE